MADTGNTADLGFLAGGGEMGALMRAHRWSATAPGTPDTWPQSLRTAVRLLLNTGHPMYVFWGAAGACFYNDAYRPSIGSERHPFSLGRPARDVWDEIWDTIGPQIEQVMSGRGATWHENQLVPITRNGAREDVYWTYSFSPIDDSGAPGGVGGVLVTCTETTEQVENARRLALSEERLELAISGGRGIGTWDWDIASDRVVADERFALLYGVDAARAKAGAPIADFFAAMHPDDLPRVQERVAAVLRSGDLYSEEYRVLQADGSQRWVVAEGRCTYAADGTPKRFAGLSFDVTERKKTERMLREQADALADLDRRKDEFLAMLSHELRNPLAPISNAVHLLRMQKDEQPVQRQARNIIERQVGQLKHLVDDLLEISRISSGRVQLRREQIAFGGIVERALETVQPLVDERQHRLSVSLPSEPIWLQADAARLEQVVVNLLTNAAKYMDEGGQIWLAVQQERDELVLRVRDTGIGISPELLPHIFELFTQADRSLDRSQGGLGIGLSLVERMVNLHGGSVAVSSTLGQGSEFVVRLPALGSGPAPAPVPPPEADAANPAAPARRILVVDDNIDAAESLGELMRLSGHEVCVVHDGLAALDAALDFRPGIVLLDIGLPGLSGLEVAQRMRQEPLHKSVVLVAMTGYGQDKDRQRSREAGFDHHLVKPADFDALQQILLASATRPS